MLTLLVPHSFIPHPLSHSLTPSPTPSTPHYNIQTVTQAMSKLVPPISLDNSENEARLRYIQEEVVRPEFVFTQVS